MNADGGQQGDESKKEGLRRAVTGTGGGRQKTAGEGICTEVPPAALAGSQRGSPRTGGAGETTGKASGRLPRGRRRQRANGGGRIPGAPGLICRSAPGPPWTGGGQPSVGRPAAPQRCPSSPARRAGRRSSPRPPQPPRAAQARRCSGPRGGGGAREGAWAREGWRGPAEAAPPLRRPRRRVPPPRNCGQGARG